MDANSTRHKFSIGGVSKTVEPNIYHEQNNFRKKILFVFHRLEQKYSSSLRCSILYSYYREVWLKCFFGIILLVIHLR